MQLLLNSVVSVLPAYTMELQAEGAPRTAMFTWFVSLQIEFARKNMHSANQKIQGAQDKLYVSWVEWKRSIGYDDTDESHCVEVR